MRCPYCNCENSKTLETRDSPENTTRRRRECVNCGKRYTTYEYIETVELMVRKKDGKLERFDVNKIIRGLQKACEKRPVTMSQINELAAQVRQDLMLKGTEEVASREIGDLIMKYLKGVDRIAYIRFASVYKQFEEPEDFRRLLLEVKKMKNGRLRNVSELEHVTDCNIRKLYAGLVAVMIVAASVSLLIGQPFVNGFVLLISAVMLVAMTLGYRQIKIICKAFKLRLKR